MFNKIILIDRLGQNAEAKTTQNNREYVILDIATHESWKNDKGVYENRTEWHRVYVWSNLSKFAKTLQKGQLITLEGTLRHREVEDEIEGTTFKHRISEVHATMKRLSKIETTNGIGCMRLCGQPLLQHDAVLPVITEIVCLETMASGKAILKSIQHSNSPLRLRDDLTYEQVIAFHQDL